MPKMPKVMESLRSIFYIKLTALKVHTLTSGTSDALNFYCFMSVVQRDLCKTSPFAQLLRQAQILSLEILNVFLRLNLI